MQISVIACDESVEVCGRKRVGTRGTRRIVVHLVFEEPLADVRIGQNQQTVRTLPVERFVVRRERPCVLPDGIDLGLLPPIDNRVEAAA